MSVELYEISIDFYGYVLVPDMGVRNNTIIREEAVSTPRFDLLIVLIILISSVMLVKRQKKRRRKIRE